ncbi:MAG: DUF3192 domain-containing protein [Deltaproteobacteria bacterium]|nr:DUF3192 domain-containing protein [Deltaproteobacteria bacterium]
MKRIFIFGLVLGSLCSCATPQMRMDRNNANLLSLEMGATKEEVLQVMGKPDLNEAYQSLHGKSVAIFFYYTQRKWQDGNTTKDECTPVVFENGKLIGWGSEFYEMRKKIDITVKQE